MSVLTLVIILYAIPFFFLLIAIELIAEKMRGTNYYRINDAINSLAIGILSRVSGIAKQVIPFTLYFIVYEHARFFTLQNTLAIWIFAFVLYDLMYYWNHRLGHEISILWAAHVVHHSSEEYNLTTALRQSSGSVFSWIFYLPLALIGIDPMLLLSVGALNLVYQFWVHTQHISTLGWMEYVFVTPSNHRVHHAQNQCYLDKNYGGVFILWDRLFGTFQEELAHEKPIYGIRKALKSWDPVRANVDVYAQLAKDSWRTANWRDKWKVWFGRTGWRPVDVSQQYPIERVNLDEFKKFDIPLSAQCKLYCLIQLSITIGVTLFLLLNAATLPLTIKFILCSYIVFSLLSNGFVLEARTYCIYTESIKHITFGVLTLLLVSTTIGYLSIGIATTLNLCLLFYVMQRPVSVPIT